MTNENQAPASAQSALEALQQMTGTHANLIERIGGAARVDAVVGQPVEMAGRTIVPLAETLYMGGYGGGLGSGDTTARQPAAAEPEGQHGFGGGYGGGGTAKARAVAVVEISAAGVRVVPVFDWTSLGLAALATLGALLAARARLNRVGQ